MNQLSKYLTEEEVNVLGDKGPRFLENLHKHLSNKVYKDSNFAWQRTQIQQIIKGAEKYDEPLNPKSWTPKQLVEHALQENVDQVHYLVSLGAKVEELEKALQKANTDALYWRKKYIDRSRELLDLSVTVDDLNEIIEEIKK